MSEYIRFGKYLRLDKVGNNFYSDKYRTKFFGSDNFYKIVYLNQIYPEIIENKESFDILVDVIKKTSKLTHANIIKVLDLHNFDNTYALITEYFAHDTLLTLMNRFFKSKKIISPAVAVYVITQVCDAISYAHNHKILHGGISPANIVITHEGLIKVKDFSLFSSLPLEITMKNLDYKQFRYFSPEYLNNKNLSPTTDIYSLSVVLYEMLTGSFIYSGKNASEIVSKVRKGRHKPIFEVNKSIPKDLALIIEKGLELDPSKRFQDISTFRNKLLKFLVKGKKIYSGQNFYTLISKALKARMEKEAKDISLYNDLKLTDYKSALLKPKSVKKTEVKNPRVLEDKLLDEVSLMFDDFNDDPYIVNDENELPQFDENDFIPDIDETMFDDDDEKTSVLFDEVSEESISSMFDVENKTDPGILPNIDNVSKQIISEKTATNIKLQANNPNQAYMPKKGFDFITFGIGAILGLGAGIVIGMMLS